MSSVLTVNKAVAPAAQTPLGSGIDKRPSDEPLAVRAPGPRRGGLGSGVVGDSIGNAKFHGGDDQAVYAYAREDLDRWQTKLDRELAERENSAFGAEAAALTVADPLVAIIGDMIAADAMRDSSAFARLAQKELDAIDRVSSRGVKQAPFVVLMGVEMPAALVEIGFLSNAADAGLLGAPGHREAIAESIARAVESFGKRYDARRGVEKGIFGLQAAR